MTNTEATGAIPAPVHPADEGDPFGFRAAIRPESEWNLNGFVPGLSDAELRREHDGSHDPAWDSYWCALCYADVERAADRQAES